MPRTMNLSDALEEYERYRKSQAYAKATIANHRTTLKRFLAVNGNIWCHAINDVHVTRFFEELSKTKQPHSQRNDHTALNLFFEYLRHKAYMAQDADPMWGRRKPPKLVKEKNRVHVSQFPALLNGAEQRCPRDRAALALLLYTLKRDKELTELRLWDLDLPAGYIKVRVHKTKQEDRIPISSELDRELRQWLTYYTEEVGPLQPHYYLVPSRDTRGIQGDDGVIRSVMQARLVPERMMATYGRSTKEALMKIGFPVVDGQGKPLYEGSHTIRRSGARALYESLVDQGYDRSLRIVQAMLGHKSLEETERYIGVTADKRTRDDLIRGQAMYPALAEVIELRRSGTDGGTENDPTGL